MSEKEETLNRIEEEQNEVIDSSIDIKEEKEEIFIEGEENISKVEDVEEKEIEDPIIIKENENIEKKTIIVKSHKTLLIISISIFILLLLFLLFSTAFAFLNRSKSTIIRGVHIKDIDVSGLTKEQALEKVSSIFGEKLEQSITLTHKEYAIDVFARAV